MGRIAVLGLAAMSVLAASCGSAQRDCAIDEATLRASVREEVLRELRSNRHVAAERARALAGGGEDEPDRAEPLAGEDAERVRVEPDGGPARGAIEPLVVIILFSDFQCPFCARIAPSLDQLIATYPREVQVVWRNNPLPFHRDAEPAAEAALEAFDQGGNELFWRYHDLLFENQRALGRADLERYAEQLRMDMASFRRALDAHTHVDRIREDQRLATRADVRGTPVLFVNGRMLPGAQPYPVLDELVREEIGIARRDLARGIPRSALFARRLHEALDAPTPGAAAAPAPARRDLPDPNAVYRVPVDRRPAHGRSDALVTIVEFSDFQCPFCARVQSTLRQLSDRYGTDLRIVFRHNPLPFHAEATPAAEAGEEVYRQRGAAGFFRFHDLLFENQRDLGRARIVELARLAGANAREVERALDDRRHRATIEADQELARSVGVSGTPAFFVNGRSLRGAQPIEAFTRLIDEELDRARARVTAGTPRGRVYEAIIANGATTPQTVPDPAAPGGLAPPSSDVVYAIPVPPRAPARGPASAPVIIQMFSDFECPFCARVRPTLERILSEYPTQVRIVWRDYPLAFHQNAMPAAEAAREVHAQGGDAAFWRYNDLLFDNQAQLDDESLVRLAATIARIDASSVRRALEQRTHRAAVQADLDAVNTANAAVGTPSFFVNGRLVQGAQPFVTFRAAIDRALAEARRP